MTNIASLFRHLPLIIIFASFVVSAQSTVQIFEPNWKSVPKKGALVTISWVADEENFNSTALYLYENDKVLMRIGDELAATGSIDWTVPVSLNDSSMYKFVIVEKAGQNHSDSTSPFRLNKPFIYISQPSPKTVVYIPGPSAFRILFKRMGFKGAVKIELLRRNNVISIFTKTGITTSSFDIDPLKLAFATTSEAYAVRISSMDNPSITTTSHTFKIDNKLPLKTLHKVGLEWVVPESSFDEEDTIRLENVSIKIGEFTDERSDKILIGKNIENSTERTVTTNESFSRFFQESLGRLLYGTPTPSEIFSVYTLRGIIKEFSIVEQSKYKANLKVEFQLFKNDSCILKTTKTAKSENWGTSYKLINYYECMSMVIHRTLAALTTDDTFRGIFKE